MAYATLLFSSSFRNAYLVINFSKCVFSNVTNWGATNVHVYKDVLNASHLAGSGTTMQMFHSVALT